MGNKESSNSRSSDESDESVDVPDETITIQGQRYVTGGSMTNQSHVTSRNESEADDDNISVPPPYIPDELMPLTNEFEDDNLPVSPESEVDIPVFDEDDIHSPQITEFPLNTNQNGLELPVNDNENTSVSSSSKSSDKESSVNTGSSKSTPEQEELPVYSKPRAHVHKNKTPDNVAVYINKDDKISPVVDDHVTPDNGDNTSSNAPERKAPDKSGTTSRITRSNSVRSSKSENSELKSHTLSTLAYQRLRNCLLNLPLEDGKGIIDKAVERVASHVIVQDYDPKIDIIMKGDEAKGIFVIIDGSVNVLSENGTDVLATLHEGDFFGEISVLFDCPCTARVQTITKCQFAILEVNAARRLLQKIDVDLIDYFVSKRYLPTSDHMDVNRTQRRLVLSCLKQLPIFEKWSEEAVKEIVLQIKPALIILYQANTLVICEQDPPVALYVIIRGRALIKKEEDVILEIDADKHPAVIGEEGMHLGCNSAVTIQTSTCCQIIIIKEECIDNVLNKIISGCAEIWKARELKWRALVNKTDVLYKTFPHLLQFEVLFHFLKNHRIFAGCSPRCVQYLALHGIPHQFNTGDTVCTQEEYDDNMVILVVKGEIELLTNPEIRYAYTINTGDVFYHCDWMGSKGEVIARSDCLVLKIDHIEITAALERNKDSHLMMPSEPV
ncbi:uncharacterized protein LOC143047407 [Mytilus galloprovincialis]|uniref:uncharacterized protein LOC143047407 n=1 Tax=Mytilus galloprovincialis TaxID=29158 RepID=UPI003F7C05E5